MLTKPQKQTRRFPLGLLLVAGISLLTIGLPRFMHELLLVPGTPILYKINAAEQVTGEELATLEKSRRDALKILEVPTALSDLGTVYLSQAQQATTAQDQQAFAKQAAETLEQSLEAAPFNSFAWTRLASTYLILGEARRDDALVAWRSSVATATSDTFLLLPRLHIGILLYDQMTEADIQALRSQLVLAHRLEGNKLVNYAKGTDLMEWLIFLSPPNHGMLKDFKE